MKESIIRQILADFERKLRSFFDRNEPFSEFDYHLSVRDGKVSHVFESNKISESPEKFKE